jgi:hypothetical protein
MGSRARVFALVAVAFVALAFAGGVVAGRASSSTPRTPRTTPGTGHAVSLYGDALVAQSRGYFAGVGDALRVRVSIHAFEDAAPCDLLPTLRDDVNGGGPDAVILAYGGNATTGCMLGPDHQPLSGLALLARYTADVHEAVTTARQAGVRVVLATPPAPRTGLGLWQALDAIYRRESAADPIDVTYVDGGVLIAPDGRFRTLQPCLPFELTLRLKGRPVCEADMVAVRAADGTSLCPGTRPTADAPCNSYSSGSTRFALTLLSAARLDIDLAAQMRSTPTTSPPPGAAGAAGADGLDVAAAQCRRHAETTKRTTSQVTSLALQRGLVWASCMADRGATCTDPGSRTQLPGAVCELAGRRFQNPYYASVTPPRSN